MEGSESVLSVEARGSEAIALILLLLPFIDDMRDMSGNRA
jgi:hypothetical protein